MLSIDKLVNILKNSYAVYCELSDEQAIRYAKHILFDILYNSLKNTYLTEATEYCIERDIQNKPVNKLLTIELHNLKRKFENCEFRCHILPMTSYPTLNTIGSSDVDIGLCVENLCQDNFEDNNLILTTIINGLSESDYVFKELIGYSSEWHDKRNRYIVYSKIVNGVEFEIKIRDYKHTLPIIKLHQKIDNLNSFDENEIEKREILTYVKYLLNNEKEAKAIFKLFIYMSYFDGIKGATKLPAV